MYYDINKKHFVADSKNSFCGWEFLGYETDIEKDGIFKVHIRTVDNETLQEIRVVYTKGKYLPKINYKNICL